MDKKNQRETTPRHSGISGLSPLLLRFVILFAIAIGFVAPIIGGNQNSISTGKQDSRQNTKPQAPSPDSPDEAMRWRRLAWVDERGEIPPNALMNASRQREENIAYWEARVQLESAGINRSSWVSRGPQNVGGRTRSLVIHPSNPNILWAGSVGGGVWKTTNGGTTWATTDDFLLNLAANCLTMDPTNPNVIYCGTGEGFFNADAINGAGIFKTTDGGTSWFQLAATASWDTVNRIAIAPANHNLILAAKRYGGIQRSTDGGMTWANPFFAQGCYYIAFNPTDSSKAIAHIIDYDFGINDWFHSAYYSTDGGASWQQSNINHVFGFLDRIELAYAPSNPAIVYASFDNGSGGKVWRSTDGGHNFSQITVSGNTGVSWYANPLWVSPSDPDFIVTGGYSLQKSTNGGGSFTQISDGYLITTQPHPDQHLVVADPGFNGGSNKRVYVCNDGGIFRTDDISTANTASGWLSLNNTYQTAQYYGAAGHGGTKLIIGGTQDNGTLRSPLSSQNATLMLGGDGGYCAVDPGDDTYCYGELPGLQIHRSQDHGISSNAIYNGILDAVNSNANFIAPFILDPNDSNRMLAGGASLWRSNNVRLGAPPTWSAIRSPGSDKISAVAVAPGDPNNIWVAQNDGKIYKTIDGLSVAPHWTTVDDNVATNPLPDRYVTRLLIDPTNANTIYVSLGGFTDGNLQRTTDGGLTWTDVTGTGLSGLPFAPIRGIARHPNNPNWLYVGTEVGVFSSEDGGFNWSAASQGPANVSVNELVFMPNSTWLLAATHGRGMWTADTGPRSTKAAFDFDGDAKTDISVDRSSNGVWYIINSSTSSPSASGWGVAGDQIVPGDYDGDGKTDIAVWRPSSGLWFIINSASGSVRTVGWGVSGDVPVPGDYDGDGQTDIAVWRPSSGQWFIINSSDSSITTVNWGVNGDMPAPGDYDGDGRTDIAVWRPSNGTWFIVNSSNGSIRIQGWGITGDKIVPADYDGDGKTDIAIWRPSTGVWFIINSSNGSITTVGWGVSSDVAVPGDYDGDGKTDIAVWRPSSGIWFIVNSSNGSITTVGWGVSGDVPVPSAFVRP